MSILAGKPRPKHVYKVGDRVMVITKPEGRGVDLTGWILNITADTVRIAHMQCDDGRPFPPADWFRATFPLADVRLVSIP